MNDAQIGRALRALRHRLGLRQADIGRPAAISQDVVSLVERGRIDRVSVRRLGRLAAELDAELVISIRMRGGDLPRLIDERHDEKSPWLVRSLENDLAGRRGS